MTPDPRRTDATEPHGTDPTEPRRTDASREQRLVVAVTGPTGTFGFGLMPLLEAEPGIAKVIGIARRPFDPSQHGWSKMEYRRGDVRDRSGVAARRSQVPTRSCTSHS